jgi:hypothetical protein
MLAARMVAALVGCAVPAAVVARADPSEPCVAAAAAHHRVNAAVLAAILRVEGMGDAQVTTNTNGTVDVGRGGINSVHFPELAKWGVQPGDLMDSCKNVFVAAWLVQRNIARYGNTWPGYAAYHSKTPQHNVRYQLLIVNELIRMGVLQGPLRPVPKLAQN